MIGPMVGPKPPALAGCFGVGWFRQPAGHAGCVGASDLRVLARSSFQSARPVQGYPASLVQLGHD